MTHQTHLVSNLSMMQSRFGTHVLIFALYRAPRLLCLGSDVGGDRDINSFVARGASAPVSGQAQISEEGPVKCRPVCDRKYFRSRRFGNYLSGARRGQILRGN